MQKARAFKMLRRFFVILLLIFSVPGVGQDPERVIKPVIEVGDRWTYRGVNILGAGSEDYEIEVASVHDDLIQVVCTRRSDGKEFDGTYTSEWSMTSSCSGFVNRPPGRMLRFPLRVGDSYPVEYSTQRVREFKYTQEVEGKVTIKGWEQVVVPAGRFRALKVEAETRVSQPGGTWLARTATFWYSPEVRRTVKTLSRALGGDTFSEELLAYKLIE